MPKTVRIYGMANNLAETPPPFLGEEVWLSNWHKGYNQKLPRALFEWTRYFNLHSRKHMDGRYPQGVKWYKENNSDNKPIYFQLPQPDIPGSQVFPRQEIQAYFATPKGPNRYFTCTVAWQIALAIMEGFERIELWGFALSDRKHNPGPCYAFERPCFFYWVQQARDRGIEVTYQSAIEALPFIIGDAENYDGPLYGYDTKPEAGWNSELQRFEE